MTSPIPTETPPKRADLPKSDATVSKASAKKASLHMGHNPLDDDDTEQGHSGHDHSRHNHSGHSHSGHGHNCLAKGAKNRRRVGIAACLTGSFMLAELAGGLISGSLALLADAGHMMTDFLALSMAWFAFVIAKRPANWEYTFGFDRFSILVAFINGLTLFAVAVWIVIEAVGRVITPGEVLAGPMLIVAILGLLVNFLVLYVLMGADQENLNIRGAVLHVMGDMLGSVAAIAAALIILKTGWFVADPLLSVLVAVIILRSAWQLIRDSGHILLEGAPRGLNRTKIKRDLLDHIDGLLALEHMHVWSITPERPIVTLVAHVGPDTALATIQSAIKARLLSEFGIDHATVEVSRRS